MISIKKSIYATIKDRIEKMRFLGQNDPKGMKKILSLIGINFVYDWVYFNDTQSEYLQKLRDLQTRIIASDCTFKKVNKDLYKNGVVEAFQAYRNVNTPQSNDDWKRVWDAPNVTVLSLKKTQPAKNVWTPDPNYQAILVEYEDTNDNPPTIDINRASIYDKMNIYVNRTTGTVWYYGTDCSWHRMTNGGSSSGMTVSDVKRIIEDYGIAYTGQTDYIESELKENASGKIGIVTNDEIEKLL